MITSTDTEKPLNRIQHLLVMKTLSKTGNEREFPQPDEEQL